MADLKIPWVNKFFLKKDNFKNSLLMLCWQIFTTSIADEFWSLFWNMSTSFDLSGKTNKIEKKIFLFHFTDKNQILSNSKKRKGHG